MFCPHCGEKNDTSNQFCDLCGTKLADNQNAYETTPLLALKRVATAARKKIAALAGFAKQYLQLHPNLNRWFKPACACLVILLVAIAIGAYVTSPDTIARNYFLATTKADASTLFSYYDMPDSPFLTKEAYADSIPLSPISIYNFEINLRKPGDTLGYGSAPAQNMTKTYDITYYLRGDATAHSTSVTLVKGQNNVALLYPSYKILPDFIVTDYTIHTFPNSTVTLNDIPVEATANSFPGNYDCAPLLNQPYTLRIENDICEPFYDIIMPSSSQADSFSDMILSREIADDLHIKSSELISAMYASAVNREPMPEALIHASDSTRLDIIQSVFSNFYDSIYDDSDQTGIVQLTMQEFSDFTESRELRQSEDFSERPLYRCVINYKYTFAHQRKSWYSEEFTTNTGTESNTAELTYAYDSTAKDWELIGISL